MTFSKAIDFIIVDYNLYPGVNVDKTAKQRNFISIFSFSSSPSDDESLTISSSSDRHIIIPHVQDGNSVDVPSVPVYNIVPSNVAQANHRGYATSAQCPGSFTHRQIEGIRHTSPEHLTVTEPAVNVNNSLRSPQQLVDEKADEW